MNNKNQKENPAKETIKNVKNFIYECPVVSLLILPLALFISFPLISEQSVSRINERHGDYKKESSYKEIDLLDKVSYTIIKIDSYMLGDKIERINNRPLAMIFGMKVGIREFTSRIERPEIQAQFSECKAANGVPLCYRAFQSYDSLYGKGVFEPATYKSFVEIEVDKRNKTLEEIRLRNEAKKLKEEEEKRTKLYSCIENEYGLICKKLKK